ncbi:DUF4126 domain-containing protein [Aeromicrobium choanae]|uniref:DUF4126 domain-containing protein n=1 Tax=Aeromicrobium choanae TaxID=1736691 RepID=A0A1T4Z6I7_9ACTN|nr:DUF4126 domain-containing protein [Aeromicrobium choanae]SKB09642.1 protein of unknown function [Aeromicrobium choanae]
MDLAALVFATGWASGVNAWATVGVLGIVARAGGSEWVPAGFGDWWVIGLSLGMFTIEFVVDKVPWLDSAWDGISTVVRPVVGAVVAWKLAEYGGELDPALLAFLGGGTALASHGVKSGVRAAVNTSPEPFSNAALSVGEDVSVVAVVLLALAHPWIALAVTAVALVLGVSLFLWLWRAVRRARARRRDRRG